MIVLIDNYDSFVHNLARYVGELGFEREVIRNDEVTVNRILTRDPLAVILSPGPGRPEQAGISLNLIGAAGMQLPILGVCLGHQCLAQAYGGRVQRAAQPMHGKSSLIEHDGRGVFQHVPSPLKVGRYHSLVAELAPKGPLVATAHTQADDAGNRELMALAHRTRPHVGIQFHPESILTDHGYDILQNFLDFAVGWRREERVTPKAAQ